MLLFGVAFVALFAVVAVSEGLGDPEVPDGDVIYVEGAPGDRGNVSKAEFDHAFEVAAAQNQLNEVPKPGDPRYAEIKEWTVDRLIESIWIEGQAAEMGLSVSDRAFADEIRQIKNRNFPNEAEFEKFSEEQRFTLEDFRNRIKEQALSTKIRNKIVSEAQEPSDGEIEDYYEVAKARQFTRPPSRDVRLIRSQRRADAERAFAELEKSSTANDWSRVARRFSDDTATKGRGGLRQNLTAGTLQEPLDAAVFDSAEGELRGPVRTGQGFYVFEVQKSTPEQVQDLEDVEAQIERQLTQRLGEEAFNAFVLAFAARWTARTFCAPGYVTKRCSNFEDDGRPESAPAACYADDPQGGRPAACPAPVSQSAPARPGSVNAMAPQGNQLAQRPNPGDEAANGTEGTSGLPQGVPPTGE